MSTYWCDGCETRTSCIANNLCARTGLPVEARLGYSESNNAAGPGGLAEDVKRASIQSDNTPVRGVAPVSAAPSSEKHSEGPKLDRDWWRAQGIEACMDRMELMASQSATAPHPDTLRLDDMERTKCYPFWNGTGWTYIVAPERSSKIERKGIGATVREAIDAALDSCTVSTRTKT